MDESGERPHDGVLGVQFEADAEVALEMAGLAGRYAERGRDLDVALDFSDASIDAADGIGVQMYDSLPREASGAKLEEMRSALAFDPRRRSSFRQWGWLAAIGNRVFGLRTAAGLSAFPLVQARKRLKGAEQDSLGFIYRYLWRWPETQTRRRGAVS